MAEQVLDTYGTVTLNAQGYGTVALAPPGYQTWRITSISVRTDQAPAQTPIPQCTVYLGSISPGTIRAQTYMGNRSTASGDLTVQPTQPLITEWTNGVPGSHATISVYGTQSMR